jgi:dienelactone hydrolase
MGSAESLSPREVTFQSGPYRLRGYVMKPAGIGPFPALVWNHGSEPDPSLDYSGELGAWFQKRGFAVFFPYRRGSSGSEGPYWKDLVDQAAQADRAKAMVEQLDAHSADVLAAIEFIRSQSYVDRARVIVAGCSFGGIEAVLAAEQSNGIAAAIDFAGASMAWAKTLPLQERMKKAVRSARVPIFLIQAENDFDTTPTIALSAEMDAAQKAHTTKIFPPHGKTPMQGHAHFCNHGMPEWGEDVLAFIRSSQTSR